MRVLLPCALALTLAAGLPLRADDPPREPGKGEAGEKGEGGKPEAGKGEPGKPGAGEGPKGEGGPGPDAGADAARAQLLERPAAARDWATRLLAATRRRVALGALTVEVCVVPDHFALLAARDVGAADPTRTVDSLRTQLQRLAEQKRRSVQRPALLLRFTVARDRLERGFVGFEGLLHEHVKVSAAGGYALAPLAQEGPLERRELMLFKPQRSGLFEGGNAPPTLRRAYVAFGGEPVTLELVARKPLPEKATELKVGLAGFLRFSNVKDGQVDFEKGGAAEVLAPALETWALPLQGLPAAPAALTELLPAAQADKD